MFRNCQKCYSMNNNNNNNCNEEENNLLETSCQNVASYEMYQDGCSCGFDEEMNLFPDNPSLGQSYVPYQFMDRTFKPCVGLKMGTIFPELVSPYVPGQSMDEINFIARTNSIGKGCNQCRD